MPDPSPYSPPRVDLLADLESNGLWRQDRILVLRPAAQFPPRCIKCNADTRRRCKTRVYWHGSGWYLLAMLSLPVYILATLLVGRRATLRVGLCGRHFLRVIIGRGFGLLSVLLMLLGFGNLWFSGNRWDWGDPNVSLVYFLGCIMSGLIAAALTRRLVATRIDAAQLRVKGCGPAFLDSLPPYLGQL